MIEYTPELNDSKTLEILLNNSISALNEVAQSQRDVSKSISDNNHALLENTKQLTSIVNALKEQSEVMKTVAETQVAYKLSVERLPGVFQDIISRELDNSPKRSFKWITEKLGEISNVTSGLMFVFLIGYIIWSLVAKGVLPF